MKRRFGVDSHPQLKGRLTGLIARKRDALTAAARLTARLKKLSEIQVRYRDVLAGVAAAAGTGNEISMAWTEATITRGRATIITLVALSALLGLGAAVFLKSSIMTPLGRLGRHVRAIRTRGELVAIPDRALVESADELGDLSRSFNGMIVELAEARRQLIARSEVEISKQVEGLKRRSPICRKALPCLTVIERWLFATTGMQSCTA